MELLTPKDVAQRLNVSVDTIYRMIYSGDISAVRVRRALRVLADSVDAFLLQPAIGPQRQKKIEFGGLIEAYAKARKSSKKSLPHC
jgi:excisionase family DNA binding protein